MILSFIAHFLSLTSSLKLFNFLGLSLHLHTLSWPTFLILPQVRRSLLQFLLCLSRVHIFQCMYLFQSMVILRFIEMSLLSLLARRSLLCSSHGHLFHCAFLTMVFMRFMINIDISIRKKISFVFLWGPSISLNFSAHGIPGIYDLQRHLYQVDMEVSIAFVSMRAFNKLQIEFQIVHK